MPADPPKVGTGRRRQGDTEPERADESQRALDREIEGETDQAAPPDHDRGWQPGAATDAGPLPETKPGTRRSIEEAGLGENLDD